MSDIFGLFAIHSSYLPQVLCNGSASHKLRFLFEVFGTLGKDGLTRRQFWRYVRSILTGLVQLSSQGAKLNPTDARRAINAASICVSSQVFGARDANSNGPSNERVMFDEWQGAVESAMQGHPDSLELQWIRLLDGKTWSRGADALQYALDKQFGVPDESPGGSGTEDEEDDSNDDGTGQGDIAIGGFSTDEATMRIHLPSLEMPSCIEITRSDIARLNTVTLATSLGSSPPEHVHNLLLGIRLPNGLVHRSDFEACLPLLARNEDDMPNALVQSTLEMIFDSYDRQHAGVADFDEIAAGFSLLSAHRSSTDAFLSPSNSIVASPRTKKMVG